MTPSVDSIASIVMSAVKTILGSALVHAAGAAALWWMVNRMMRINDVGWLERLGWPYDSVILFSCLGAAIGFLRHRREEKLRHELATVSSEAALELSEKPHHELPAMPLFQNLRRVTHPIAGERDGVPVQVFDLTTVTQTDDSETEYTRTVALLPAAGLAHFRLNAKTLGYRFLDWLGATGVTFDPAAAPTDADREAVAQFARLYQLRTDDVTELASGRTDAPASEDAARSVFTLPVLRMLSRRPGWSIESHGGHLAFWRGTEVLSAGDRVAMLGSAVAIRAALLHASDPAGVLPPRPGTDQARQSARFQGALLGGLIGGFASFFIAFIVTASLFFSRTPEDFGFPFELLLFPPIMVIGTLLGVFIGSRLPICKPLLQKPRDKKLERRVGCAGLFGLFGGFLGGAMLGAVLGEVIGLDIRDTVPRITLFFGGAGVGAIGGPILCAMAAKKLLTRRAGTSHDVGPP